MRNSFGVWHRGPQLSLPPARSCGVSADKGMDTQGESLFQLAELHENSRKTTSSVNHTPQKLTVRP